MTLSQLSESPATPLLRHVPIDLDQHADVEAFLIRSGLGALDKESLTSPPGRNAIWIGRTSSGKRVFVKQLQGLAEDLPPRLRRLLAFQRFSEHSLPADQKVGPRLVDFDPVANIVVFEEIDAPQNGAQLTIDEAFTNHHAHLVGRLLATVHATSHDPHDDLDTSPFVFPSTVVLQAIPSQMFDTLSFGEIQAWALLQQDADLIASVERLLEMERCAPRSPTHGDFRLDQLLFVDHGVYLADWEEFRLGDSARDVGAFAGEWLYRSALDITTSRGGQAPVGKDLTHQEIMHRGAANLERLVPRVRSFWSGYREKRPVLDPLFVERATAFAGWHAIDRLLAGGTRSTKLTGIERAAAGIGRCVLVQPDRFSAVIGLGATK